MEKIIVLTPEDLEQVRHGEYSEKVMEHIRIMLTKPGYSDFKKTVMLALREKHHMSNTEIAQRCGATYQTVLTHIGKQTSEMTHANKQMAGRIRRIKGECRREQEFAANQQVLMRDSKARQITCGMCGRKFYTKGHRTEYCDICRKVRMDMRARGMTTEQINAQIEQKRQAEQIMDKVRDIIRIAGIADSKNILPFPAGK